MIKPASMWKLRAFVPSQYADAVLLSVGQEGSIHFIDLKERLGDFGGALEAVNPGEAFVFRTTDLTHRLSKLMKTLDVAEIGPTESSKFEGRSSSKDALTEVERTIEEIEGLAQEYTSRLAEYESAEDHSEESAEESQKLREQLKTLGAQRKEQLQRMSLVLEVQRRIAELKLMLLRSKRTFYLEGWVPKKNLKKIIERIENASDRCAATMMEPPEHGEEPPTLLMNPSFIRPVESLVSGYGLPSQRELDPTKIMAITFPLVFGLMFADIGHGLLLLLFGLIAIYLRKRMANLGDILKLVLGAGELYVLLGAFGVFGGLLFGEFFGYHLGHFGIEEPPLGFLLKLIPGIGKVFSPVDEPMKMFKLSIMFGVIQISIGILFNLFNKLGEREYKGAVFESGCWLWFYLGLMYLVFTFKFNIDLWFKSLNLVAPLVIAPIVVMLAGKALTEGFMEGFSFVVEAATSSIGNTVSYGRILALNLSHAYMSSMFVIFSEGQILPLQILIIAVGTIVVMVLEGLIIFVHTVRLHWVEWFSKFHKGEGIKYVPFKSI